MLYKNSTFCILEPEPLLKSPINSNNKYKDILNLST